jgi:hypothetical protein
MVLGTHETGSWAALRPWESRIVRLP